MFGLGPGGTGGSGAPPSAIRAGTIEFGVAPGGTGGSGAPPSATKLSAIGCGVVLGGTGGSGAPPSAIRAGTIEFGVAPGGTGGSGAPPSEYKLPPRYLIDDKIVEQPRSAALKNRTEHEAFLWVMIFSLCVGIWPLGQSRNLTRGCFLSCVSY